MSAAPGLEPVLSAENLRVGYGGKPVLLDEPASGLDRGSYDRFVSLLRNEVKSGVTICIIEHNLDIVQSISDRIAFLDQGKLLAEGEPKTILSDPALAAIYFGERAQLRLPPCSRHGPLSPATAAGRC